jgi:hypothetical protein
LEDYIWWNWSRFLFSGVIRVGFWGFLTSHLVDWLIRRYFFILLHDWIPFFFLLFFIHINLNMVSSQMFFLLYYEQFIFPYLYLQRCKPYFVHWQFKL